MFGKKFWKQFALALGLFLLGYLTFNSNLFSQTVEKPKGSNEVGASADLSDKATPN